MFNDLYSVQDVYLRLTANVGMRSISLWWDETSHIAYLRKNVGLYCFYYFVVLKFNFKNVVMYFVFFNFTCIEFVSLINCALTEKLKINDSLISGDLELFFVSCSLEYECYCVYCRIIYVSNSCIHVLVINAKFTHR
jgi:hypothetical protein